MYVCVCVYILNSFYYIIKFFYVLICTISIKSVTLWKRVVEIFPLFYQVLLVYCFYFIYLILMFCYVWFMTNIST